MSLVRICISVAGINGASGSVALTGEDGNSSLISDIEVGCASVSLAKIPFVSSSSKDGTFMVSGVIPLTRPINSLNGTNSTNSPTSNAAAIRLRVVSVAFP